MLATLTPRQTDRRASKLHVVPAQIHPADGSSDVAQPFATPGWHEAGPVWQHILSEARDLARTEPAMGPMMKAGILDHDTLGEAIALRVAEALAAPNMPARVLQDTFAHAYRADAGLERAGFADVFAAQERDPACTCLLQPLLYFKGFIALQAHRLAHFFWHNGRRDFALYVQSRVSEVFTLDIHPAARIGQGVMLDHAHSVVIGETAIVGDNVSILHSVTLGGTGKQDRDRHPKVGDDVMIGAGATILGNIKIANGARIAAGSVVLKNVEKGDTVAGVPAKPVFSERDVIAGALSG